MPGILRYSATVWSMRVATWNVNSVKQRLPRLLPWLDERRPDVVCLQETKLADDAFVELLGDELAERGYAVAVHGEAAWNGVAILSRVGLDDVVDGAPRRARASRIRRRARCRRHAAGIRVVSVYVPNGREPDSEHYRYKLAWLARCATRRRRPGGHGRLRRHEHRADRRGRVRSRGLRRPDPRDRRPSARRSRELQSARPARRRPRPLARRAGVHLLGLPGRDVPPGPRDADRSGARRRRRSPSVSGRPGSTGRPARAAARATTPR